MGYAALNGQASVKECWQSLVISVKDLEALIAFSDGFVSYHETAEEKIGQLSERLLSEYLDKELSLKEMLEKKRKKEIKDSKVSYITHDEATALALEFRR